MTALGVSEQQENFNYYSTISKEYLLTSQQKTLINDVVGMVF